MVITDEERWGKFGIIRPDEVAECWNGVLAVPGLYEALWAFAPEYKSPSPEESEEPVYGLDTVADFWDRISPEHQAALVRLEQENNHG